MGGFVQPDDDSFSDVTDPHPDSSSLQLSVDPSAPHHPSTDPEDDLISQLPSILAEEGVRIDPVSGQAHVPAVLLLDLLWETDRFRKCIQDELNEVLTAVGGHPDPEEGPEDAVQAEQDIFMESRNAKEYIELSAKVILYYKSKLMSGKPGK